MGRTGSTLVVDVVPMVATTAIGLFQLRALDRSFTTAEWGFALASAFWGTGVFEQAAALGIALTKNHGVVCKMQHVINRRFHYMCPTSSGMV